MEIEGINEEKMYSVLRSLYRYREMTEENFPELMIESEAKLLEARFALLTAREIFEIVKIWPEYLAEQMAFDVIDNQEFEQYLRRIN